MPKEKYKERLAFCRDKAYKRNADSGDWIRAAEVYQHLIECNLTHSGPNPTCQWTGSSNESSKPSGSDGI